MFLRRVFAVLLCAVFAQTCPGICFADPYPPDIKRIKDRGKIIVAQYRGVEPGFFDFDDDRKFSDHPYFVYQSRHLVGCDISLAMKIAEKLGVRLELDRSPKDFNTVCKYVASGKADLGISKLSVTLQRSQYLRFTQPYATLHTGVLIDRLFVSRVGRGKNILALCNQAGTRVGVVRGTSYVEFAQELFPKASLILYSGFEPMLKAVLSGEVDGIYDEEPNIVHRLLHDPKLALRLRFVLVPGKKDNIGIAVAPKNTTLVAFLNLLLDSKGVRTSILSLLKSRLKIGLDSMSTSPVSSDRGN
jgi:polar amino acid transport system substrate-binding protein